MHRASRFARAAAAAAALIILVAGAGGCGDNDPQGPVCPLAGDEGPALDGNSRYLIVASSLSEEWAAAELVGYAMNPLPARGLTGRAPNDVDVVGDRLVVVNSLDNNLSVVDLPTGVTVGCIDLGENVSPWEFSADPLDADRGWVTGFVSGEVIEVDLKNLKVARRAAVGAAAEGLLVTETHVAVTLTGFEGCPDVCNYGHGEVVVLNRATLAVERRLAVPPNAQALLAGADGRAHVVCSGNYGDVTGQVARIEADWSAVRDTLVVGGAPGRGTVATDGKAYLVSYFGGVLVYDTADFTLLNGVGDPLLPETGYMDVGAVGNELFLADFEGDRVVRAARDTGTITGRFPQAGDGPAAVTTYTH